MRIVGPTILTLRLGFGTLFQSLNCAGTCLALPGAVQSSRTSSFSSLTTRANVSIFRARSAQKTSLRPPSVPETLALFARQVSQAVFVTRLPRETNNCITPVHRLRHHALLLLPKRRLACHSPTTRFRSQPSAR